MEHISLYRKWRPQTFTEVVGQARVTNTLANALSSGRLVHAYLFSGPRGTGKTSTARILAKAINCVNGPTATPCGVCEACVSISEGTALDVIEIDAASNRKIDEIRDLLDKIPYTPTSLRSKVYIIDEVHQLTPEASSALLKTLEEPPGHIIFVLATTEPHKLLPTIVSRCQKFDFSMVSAQDIAQLLEHIATHEGIDVDTEAIEMIAEHAHGSVRDAIGVMDQISNLSGEQVTRTQLAELLGEVETELVFRMVDLMTERDTPGALALVGGVFEGGKDPRRFLESLISHLRNLFLIQNAANPETIVEATVDHFQRLSEQSNVISRHEVIKLIERLGDTFREMRWSENPRLILECAIVKNTSLDADISIEGLAFRIEELERKLVAQSNEVPADGTGQKDDTGGDSGMNESAMAAKPATPAATRSAGGAGGETVQASAPRVAESTPDRNSEKAAPTKETATDTGGQSTTTSAGGPAPVVEGARPESDGASDAREGGKGSSEREKVRRTWMALMADLKKTGQMKLYALLTKARVQGAKGGSLVLGFPEDALFQMDVLADSSADIATIEETWQRFAGEPVKVKLVTASAGARKPTPAQPESRARDTEDTKADSSADDRAPLASDNAEARSPEQLADVNSTGGSLATDAPEAGGSPLDSRDKAMAKKSKKANSKDIARKLKESFDGEIIEEKKEGKD